MKRRQFVAAVAGLGAGGVLAGATDGTAAEETRVPEQRRQIYKCQRCKTIVEVLVPGRPTLVHCGVPMKLLPEQTADVTTEKHVPVIEKIDGGYRVIVGSTPHPMTKAHWIMWIELVADGKTYRQYLEPGDKPEATFLLEAEKVYAREYCNLHGLWRGE